MLAKALQGAATAAEKIYIESVFSTFLYTGNGSTQTITNGIDLSGKGGLVWIKGRQTAFSHIFVDTTRGATKFLSSNNTTSEQTAPNTVPSFSSTGFTAGTDNQVNLSGDNFASWTFRKAEKFFDVVTYTGTGSARTVAHNLGSVPGTIIIKRTDSTDDWLVYHRSVGATKGLYLNDTSAEITASTFFNNTEPTSTVFTVGTNTKGNASGGTYVAYLFAHDAGGFGDSGNESVVSCGSYTGNGSTSGPTVTLGWEPQWLLFKRTDGITQWFMHDNMREMSLTNTAYLNAADSAAEALFGSALYRLLPNGFQLNTNNANFNASGGTYIYIAIRRGPMKTPTDATKVFSANTWTGTGTTQQITTGFFPDACLTIDRNKNATNLNYLFDNLRGVNVESYTNSTAAEGADSGKAFTMTGLSNNSGNLNSTLGVYVGEFFRRAPGFFDVVAYTGTSSARTVNHNLGVVPELMIVKRRNGSDSWLVYSASSGNTQKLVLNTTAGLSTDSCWNNTSPTSSVFSVGAGGSGTNDSGDTYIAYLFASCPGVSKVGSYTGTGTTLSVDCGFTAGSRLVLIKRTDSTGSWYIWDSARGIVSGDDSYLLLNSDAAEVTNTDYIDPLSSGFQITSTAPAEINASGGSYIFLSVA